MDGENEIVVRERLGVRGCNSARSGKRLHLQHVDGIFDALVAILSHWTFPQRVHTNGRGAQGRRRCRRTRTAALISRALMGGKYFRIISAQERPAKFLAGRLLAVTGLCRTCTISQKGFRLRFFPSNLSERLWVNPNCRSGELNLLQAYLREGDHVIDVGSNIGDTVLTTSTIIGSGGKVWAIEPHPRIYSYLLSNLTLNGASNVTPANVAVGCKAGVIKISDSRRDDMNRVGEIGIPVRLDTLDAVVPYRGTIDLLKIDVEGFELDVLKGATSILQNVRCISLEAYASHLNYYGRTFSSAANILTNTGFAIFQESGPNRFRHLPDDFQPTMLENLVAIRSVDEFIKRTGWGLDK